MASQTDDTKYCLLIRKMIGDDDAECRRIQEYLSRNSACSPDERKSMQFLSQIHNVRLLYPWEIEAARLYPEMFLEYCLLREDKELLIWTLETFGDSDPFLEFQRKYEVPLQHISFIMEVMLSSSHGKDVERYLVTREETGCTLVISRFNSQTVSVASIWELATGSGLFPRPVPDDILQEIKGQNHSTQGSAQNYSCFDDCSADTYPSLASPATSQNAGSDVFHDDTNDQAPSLESQNAGSDDFHVDTLDQAPSLVSPQTSLNAGSNDVLYDIYYQEPSLVSPGMSPESRSDDFHDYTDDQVTLFVSPVTSQTAKFDDIHNESYDQEPFLKSTAKSPIAMPADFLDDTYDQTTNLMALARSQTQDAWSSSAFHVHLSLLDETYYPAPFRISPDRSHNVWSSEIFDETYDKVPLTSPVWSQDPRSTLGNCLRLLGTDNQPPFPVSPASSQTDGSGDAFDLRLLYRLHQVGLETSPVRSRNRSASLLKSLLDRPRSMAPIAERLYGKSPHFPLRNNEIVSINRRRSTESSLLQAYNTDHESSLGGHVRIQVSDFEIHDQSHPQRERAEKTERVLFNRSRITETFLVIAAQAALTLLTVTSSGTSSLSPNRQKLLRFSVACNFISFICFLYAILLFGRKPGSASRFMTGVGYVSTTCGYLAATAMGLDDNMMVWVTVAACIVAIPALAGGFMK